MIFWLKPNQARTANKGDSIPITEVTGEFSARSCDPPHPYMKNAPMAQKFCDQGRKTTFATQSARSRRATSIVRCLILRDERTRRGQAATSHFDPTETCSALNCCCAKLGIRGRSTRGNFLIDQIANQDHVGRPGP